MIADFGPGRKKHADPDYALRLVAGDFMAYKKMLQCGIFS